MARAPASILAALRAQGRLRRALEGWRQLLEAGCDQAPSTDSLSTTPSSCAAWTASIVSRAAFEASAPGNAFKGLRRRRCRSGGAKPGRWRQTSQHCVSACWGPKLQECPSSGAVGEGAPPSPRVSNPFRSPALSAGGSLKPEGGRTRECVLFIGTPSVTLALSRRVVARGWMLCWALLYIKKRLKLITSPIPTFSLPHPTLPSFPPSPRTSAFLSSSKFRSLIICSLTASRPLALSLSSRPLALCSLDLSPSRSLALSRYLFIRVIICVVASDWRKLPLRF